MATAKKNQKKVQPLKDATPCFQKGDLAVYPAHGVGRIESIETRVINNETHEFYMLKVLESSMLIMVPVANVKTVGLRNIIQVEDIAAIYDVLADTQSTPTDTQTWNRRYREYMEKIKTGSLHDVAAVFRDLYLLKSTKDLSFGERKLFDTATSLLVKELSTAKKTDETAVMTEIEAVFSNGRK